MKKFFSVAAALTLSSPLAFSADTTWISTSSTDWSVSGNWSAGPPNATVGAIFLDSATIQHSVALGNVLRTSQGIQFSLFAGGSGFNFGFSGTTALQLRNGGTANGIINNDDSTQIFNVPIALYTASGFAGGAQTWNAAAGNMVFSGIYGATTPTVALGGASGRLTIDGAFDVTIGSPTGRGDITGTGAGITKNGAGTLTLGGTVANTYSGSTIINAGTVVAAKVNAFGNGAGSLLFNGGTLVTGGFNQAFGVLSLGTVAVTLDLTGEQALTFANSSAASWGAGGELDIIGWSAGDSLRFGTDATGLTEGQIGQIRFTDLEGVYATGLDSSGFLTVVPEPSIVTLSLVGGFGLALTLIYRRRKP